jgi:ABC-type uncharacterized transport system permease subunit
MVARIFIIWIEWELEVVHSIVATRMLFIVNVRKVGDVNVSVLALEDIVDGLKSEYRQRTKES